VPVPAFFQPGADINVPDGAALETALGRTTHLGIMAHADDLEFSAWPGIRECCGSNECWFTGVVVTDGSGSPRGGACAGWTDERMIEARKIEQREAAKIGACSAGIPLAHPSRVVMDPSDPAPRDDLVAILAAMRPRQVFLHNPAAYALGFVNRLADDVQGRLERLSG
jgi:LmbE family N-acetylglucosaminyl deacetylase